MHKFRKEMTIFVELKIASEVLDWIKLDQVRVQRV